MVLHIMFIFVSPEDEMKPNQAYKTDRPGTQMRLSIIIFYFDFSLII